LIIFVVHKKRLKFVERLKIIAFTHKAVDLALIGKLHIDADQLQNRLTYLKEHTGADELMYISTCNRVEFLVATPAQLDNAYLTAFFTAFNPGWDAADVAWAVNAALIFEGQQALRHFFNVASSIDSLVIGEREIITQVRNAYEICNKFNLTGDLLRIVTQRSIQAAKEVYTSTNIARNPVSVVSLAYRQLIDFNIALNARFLIIGSGVTNTAMANYLKKHGFTNFVIFNRTRANAEALANTIKGTARSLDELAAYKGGFDVLLTCTGADKSIITPQLYQQLIGNDTSKKIIIDLAIPNDLDTAVLATHHIQLISVNTLQETASNNLKEREKELVVCERLIEAKIHEFDQVIRTRKLELAMNEVPQKIKEIRETAINEVFATQLKGLDTSSKEVLDEIINYFEKKYISVPMKMAREILIGGNSKTK
jgi:glutamyl-tRNA reductase